MLSGGAFLVLWNDVQPAAEAEYNRWHSVEHVPERVAVPGLRSGRRYVAPDAALHRYLTLYDIDDTGVLSSVPYRALLQGPTAWSQRMRPHFRNLLRIACTRLGSAGNGMGGVLLALRLAGLRDRSAFASGAARACAELCALHGVVAAHCGIADDSVAALPWVESGEAPQAVVLVESADERALAAASGSIAAIVEKASGAAGMEIGLPYRLAHAVGRA